VFSACKELGSPERELEFRSKGAGVQRNSAQRGGVVELRDESEFSQKERSKNK